MGRLATLAVYAALFSSGFVYGGAPTCGNGVTCPASSPCCSAYGECGVGAYCLGGCDPQSSFSLDSCTAKSVCKSGNFVMNSLDDVQRNTIWLGDSSKVNWVSEGTPVVYQDNSVLLTMAQDTTGTLLSSTHYVWYGKISVKMKSSRGQGVVTAFVMMSDVKDEIDFEFVGNNVEQVQSNYYWQGVLDYNNEKGLAAANTDEEYHTYTYDWSPDSITWSVDGAVLRTLDRLSTWNSTSQTYHFPQTPARIQLSLWPAGLSSNDQGTIEWAGGLINWNSPYMTNGYYYAQISEVNVECYKPPPEAIIDGSKSYIYKSDVGTNNTVAITNDNTVLNSFYATGSNPGFTPKKKGTKNKPNSTGSAPPLATTNVQTVPGITGTGARGDSQGDSDVHGGQAVGGSGSSHGTVYVGGGNGNFIQGKDPIASQAAVGKERAVSGSAFAVLVALLALVAL